MGMGNRALLRAGSGEAPVFNNGRTSMPMRTPMDSGISGTGFTSLPSVGQIVFERGNHPYFLDMGCVAVAVLYGELALTGAFDLPQPTF